jgi:heme-degrading monooxygenase HmoA
MNFSLSGGRRNITKTKNLIISPLKLTIMISRIWHGYTTFENADTYERLLKEEIFIGIKHRNIKGYKGIQLLRRQLDNETEFITIMWFDSLDSVREFAGKDYEKAVVPDKAQKVLSHFDKASQHYNVLVDNYTNQL